jgi:hypothetical protein
MFCSYREKTVILFINFNNAVLNAEKDNAIIWMFPLLAASTPKEVNDTVHPSVKLIFWQDDMSELAFSIRDNRLSVIK